MTEADIPDPWRRHLSPQPRKKTDKQMLIANIMTSLEELQEILPDDPEEDDEEPEDVEFTRYKKEVLNKLRRDSKWLKRPR